MTKDEKTLKAIETLAEVINLNEFKIEGLEWTVKSKEKEIADLRKQLDEEREYNKNLNAKLYDLEERIAIMTEPNEPESEWETEPPAEEIVETVNVTKVMKGV